MLRICERKNAAIPFDRFRFSAEKAASSLLTLGISSGRFQKTILADGLVGELAHDGATL
jgi:hypothetical protein